MAHVGEHLYSRAGKQTNNNNNKKPGTGRKDSLNIKLNEN
jgi:hypothetical protein